MNLSKYMLRLTLVLVVTLVLGSCGVKQTLDEAQRVALQFTQDMAAGNDEACLEVLHPEVPSDSFLAFVLMAQQGISANFLGDLSCKAVGYKVRLGGWSTDSITSNNMKAIKGLKQGVVQISDRHHFSFFKITMDSQNRVLSVQMAGDIYPIPNMQAMWWIGGGVLLVVFLFNVYVLIRVYKSDVTRKWLKYLIIALLNLPVIGYTSVGGVFFNITVR